jgi:phospho-N-acetylmuramoyl-pentapeptide-transferase
MTYALLVGGLSFIVALIAGRPLVKWLRARHLGKAISELGPSSHQTKSGTPTMGGLLIFGTVALVTLFTNLTEHRSILLPFSVVVAMLAVGVVDDFGTLVGQRRKGLSWRIKIALIAITSIVVAFVCYYGLDAHSVNVPWVGKHDLGPIYIGIAFLVVFATTTSVAITDGLDGLLGGTAAVAFTAYGIIAVAQEQAFLATFCLTVVGALLGFLWFNAHPASVFMGDTGALPLGAALATVALMTGHWLLLPIIGIVFVAEAASDVIQIAYFQTTGGRRLFRMTPLHHHFELVGWSEPQVVTRLWLVGIAGGMVGIALALAV